MQKCELYVVISVDILFSCLVFLQVSSLNQIQLCVTGTHLTESDESINIPIGPKGKTRINIIDHKFKKRSDSSIATDTSSSITSLPGDDSAILYPGIYIMTYDDNRMNTS